MDTSDSSQDSRVLLESKKCKLKTHAAFHSNKKQKKNSRKKIRTTKSVNRYFFRRIQIRLIILETQSNENE